MAHRTFLALAVVSACLAACLGRTTSLGGPEGSQSSANSAEDGGADGQSRAADSASDDFDAGNAYAANHLGPVCQGYTWIPVPGSVACQYLLPSGRPPGDDPRLDPMTWNLDGVYLEIWVSQVFDDQGFYVPSAEACGTGDGWYYVEPDSGEPRTLFGLCPKSCASAAEPGAYLRLTAITSCEP